MNNVSTECRTQMTLSKRAGAGGGCVCVGGGGGNSERASGYLGSGSSSPGWVGMCVITLSYVGKYVDDDGE